MASLVDRDGRLDSPRMLSDEEDSARVTMDGVTKFDDVLIPTTRLDVHRGSDDMVLLSRERGRSCNDSRAS